VDTAVIGAWIGAGIAILVALMGAYLTVWNSHRQRAVDFVAAALSHMGGGSQERSAGVAALMALRGPLDRRPAQLEVRGWLIYGPAVGQQLYRQLIYVLNYGSQRYHAHEVENVISMAEWLLKDSLLGFDEPGQRHRLAVSMKAYAAAAPTEATKAVPSASQFAVGQRPPDLNDTSIGELLGRLDGWMRILTDGDGRTAPPKARGN
jgi:hypothetical protein